MAYTRYWSMTWDTNVSQKKLPPVGRLKAFLDREASLAVFQVEKGSKKQKTHYQGYLELNGKRTSKQKVLLKFAAAFKNVAGLTLKPVYSKVAIKSYVTKEEGRIDGPFYCGTDEKYNEENAAMELREWQQKIYDLLTNPMASALRGRRIVSVHDTKGKSGKSTFVKFLRTGQKKLVARKLPVASVQQLNSAVYSITSETDVDLFMIDITRSLGKDQTFSDLFACLEDVINGYVVDVMYGKYREAVFKPPMIVVFTNFTFDELKNNVSQDRWVPFTLENGNLNYVEKPTLLADCFSINKKKIEDINEFYAELQSNEEKEKIKESPSLLEQTIMATQKSRQATTDKKDI